MDPERQIRLLYPPLFLVASLLWGLKLDPTKSIADVVPLGLFKDPGAGLFALVASGGVVVVGCGLLIGSISLLILRGTFCLFKNQPHEAVLTDETRSNIQGLLGLSAAHSGVADTLFLAATFDHEKLEKSIHAWLLRRWSAFNIGASSIVALGLALLIGRRLGIMVWPEWTITSIVFAAMFAVTARWAWMDTMNMIAFQARRLSTKKLVNQPE